MRISFPSPVSGFPLLHPEHLAKLFFGPFSSPALTLFKPFEESPNLSGEMHVKDGNLDVRIFRDRNKIAFSLAQPSSWYKASAHLEEGAVDGNIEIQYSAADGKQQGLSIEPGRLAEVRMPLVLAAAHARFQDLIAPYLQKPLANKATGPLPAVHPSFAPVSAQELSRRFQDLLKKSSSLLRSAQQDIELKIKDEHGPKVIKGTLLAYDRLWSGKRYHDGFIVRAQNTGRYVLVSMRVSTLPDEIRLDRCEILESLDDLLTRGHALFGVRLHLRLMAQIDALPAQIID